MAQNIRSEVREAWGARGRDRMDEGGWAGDGLIIELAAYFSLLDFAPSSTAAILMCTSTGTTRRLEERENIGDVA